MPMVRDEPWFPLLGRASPDRVIVWNRGPGSYVVILPAQSDAGRDGREADVALWRWPAGSSRHCWSRNGRHGAVARRSWRPGRRSPRRRVVLLRLPAVADARRPRLLRRVPGDEELVPPRHDADRAPVQRLRDRAGGVRRAAVRRRARRRARIRAAATDGFSRWEVWSYTWTSLLCTLGAVFVAARLVRRRGLGLSLGARGIAGPLSPRSPGRSSTTPCASPATRIRSRRSGRRCSSSAGTRATTRRARWRRGSCSARASVRRCSRGRSSRCGACCSAPPRSMTCAVAAHDRAITSRRSPRGRGSRRSCSRGSHLRRSGGSCRRARASCAGISRAGARRCSVAQWPVPVVAGVRRVPDRAASRPRGSCRGSRSRSSPGSRCRRSRTARRGTGGPAARSAAGGSTRATSCSPSARRGSPSGSRRARCRAGSPRGACPRSPAASCREPVARRALHRDVGADLRRRSGVARDPAEGARRRSACSRAGYPRCRTCRRGSAFKWKHDVPLAAYDKLVGVHVLGETYPGLNAYSDQLSRRSRRMSSRRRAGCACSSGSTAAAASRSRCRPASPRRGTASRSPGTRTIWFAASTSSS